MDFIPIVVYFVGCPLGAAWFASRKGRSVILWAFIGVFLGLLGVLLAAFIQPLSPPPRTTSPWPPLPSRD